MEGGGFYNRHSTLQNAAIQKALPLWKKAIDKAAFNDGIITIADYGSSQGQNSMAPIGLAIDTIRQKASNEVPINVVHTDLPGNDFSSLFHALIEDTNSYLNSRTNIFPSAIGRTYFEQLFPSNSVDIAWNSWTLQWMSRNPVEDPDFLYGAFSPKEWVREAVAEQLAQDWQSFLRLRSAELKPRGKMFCLFGSKGQNMIGWEWTVNALWGAVLDMWKEGLLSDAEKLRINLPLGPRDINAIKEPFEENGLFAGLRLEHAEVMQSPDPFWPEYQDTKDAKQFGQNWKNFAKAVFAPVFKTQLDPSKDGSKIVDEIFERFARAVADSPRETEHFVGIAIVEKVEPD